MNNKTNLSSMRNVRFAVGFMLVALIAGIYFLFNSFPAGPSLNAQANELKAVKPLDAEAASRYNVYAAQPGNEAAAVNNWNRIANAPSAAVNAPSVGASTVRRNDNSTNYAFHFYPDSGKVIAPSDPSSSIPQQYRQWFPLKTGSSSSASTSASSTVQRVDIGGGYMLENSAQGSRIVAPNNQTSSSSHEPALVPGFVLEVSRQNEQGYVSASAAENDSTQASGLVPGFVLEVSRQTDQGYVPASAAENDSSDVQTLDMGAEYVLRFIGPNARIAAQSSPLLANVPASAPSENQRLDMDAEYVRRFVGPNARIMTPSSEMLTPASAPATVQRLYIGNGYTLEKDSQGSRIVAPSEAAVSRAYPPSGAEWFYIGNGYVLEMDAQGSRVIAPNGTRFGPASVPSAGQNNPQFATKTTDILTKIDIGGGYMRVHTKFGWATIRSR